MDIGTNSVGWAVTDGRYHLLKKGSQHLWGADLFEEAMPAKDRRMHRSARRRYTRRKRRLILLQELMNKKVQYDGESVFLSQAVREYVGHILSNLSRKSVEQKWFVYGEE